MGRRSGRRGDGGKDGETEERTGRRRKTREDGAKMEKEAVDVEVMKGGDWEAETEL